MYFSTKKKPFKDYPKYYPEIHKQAMRLTRDNFEHKDRNNVRYRGKNNKFRLNLKNNTCYNYCSCNCACFIKEAVCMHLLGYSYIYHLDLCGEEYAIEPKTFSTQMKRGRGRKTNRYGTINFK